MLPFLITAIIFLGLPTIYLAYRFKEYRKFLAGAFFVSSTLQFYFYLVNLSIPLIGTDAVQTPDLSLFRSIVHFFLFLLCLYFGFFRKPKRNG